MWSRQIFVAILCTFVVWQQVAAVVNNNPSSVEKSSPVPADNPEESKEKVEDDSQAAATEDKGNRREATLGDTYGAPVPVPLDSYLPAEPSNTNFPVPVYGVPESQSNSIVYPEPPPDIPPAISVPSSSYGLSSISNSYGPPQKVNFLPHGNSYAPPSNNFGPSSNTYGPPRTQSFGPPSNTYGPPKFLGPVRKPVYGPPRSQYGPPGKPVPSNKYGFKPPYKNNFGFGSGKFSNKPLSTYGPPVGYFKDNYSPIKFTSNFNSNNFQSHDGSFGQFGSGGVNNKYGPPTFDLGGGKGISSQYGVPDINFSNQGGGNLISPQYGPPNNNILGSPKPQYGPPQAQYGPPQAQYGPPQAQYGPPQSQYGPPQPSPHPRPPHPGAPAPPTPPDIKYDGWQPIPGLISRVPSPEYGVPSGNHQHVEGGDLSYNKDLSPPPLDGRHTEHQSNSDGSLANLELENSYGPPQPPQKAVSDSYGAPLNTVTGSGGIVSTSGEEAHGHRNNHNEHNHHVGLNNEHNHHVGLNNEHNHHVGLNIGLSTVGISGQNVDAIKSIGYEIFPGGSSSYPGGQPSNTYGAPPTNSYASSHSYSNVNFGSSHSHNSFNSHKTLGHKGFSSNSGIGLIPPSGIYGAPSGSYGTPLFSKGPSSYLPPKPSKGFGHHGPSNLFGPSSHSSVSFQNVNHGSSSYNNIGSSSGYTSYNAPLNIVDGSYNIPQGSQLGSNLVSLDYSHPGLTIDLTQSHGQTNNFANAPHDCKSQSLPSLSYGVPSVNSYTAALSSLTTNIGHSGSAISGSYGVPESLPIPQHQIGVEPKPHETYGVPDLTVSHSQKVSSEVKANSIETDTLNSEGKTYGKSVAANFGPSSELVQSQSIDFSNIPLQGALGSYTLQIQSAEGGQSQVPHGQVLNDGLLQSILAAIEQPKGSASGQPIIQFQKSLEQQNFVTNDTISSVVEQLTDAEIRHSTQLAKDEILKTSEVKDSEINYPSMNGDVNIAYSSPSSDVQIQYSPSSSDQDIQYSPSSSDETIQYSSSSSDQDTQYSSPTQYIITASDDVNEDKTVENNEVNSEDSETPVLQDNGIALYFNNNQRLKKETDESATGEQKFEKTSERNE